MLLLESIIHHLEEKFKGAVKKSSKILKIGVDKFKAKRYNNGKFKIFEHFKKAG